MKKFVCTHCGEKKPPKDFYLRKDATIGRRTSCKDCCSKQNRIRKHGVSFEEYTRMSKEQGDVCAVCLQKPEDTLSVDHDHDTKKIRGLLCGRCNKAIGLLQDSIENLNRAASYLEKASKS